MDPYFIYVQSEGGGLCQVLDQLLIMYGWHFASGELPPVRGWSIRYAWSNHINSTTSHSIFSAAKYRMHSRIIENQFLTQSRAPPNEIRIGRFFIGASGSINDFYSVQSKFQESNFHYRNGLNKSTQFNLRQPFKTRGMSFTRHVQQKN